MINLEALGTEQTNLKTTRLDRMSPLEVIQAMNEEDKTVAYAISKVLDQVSLAVTYVKETFEKGGRLIYIGAGTSGRVGVTDAAECPPTFGTPPEQVIALIAGGEKAFIKAVEGAEDNEALGVEDLKKIHLTPLDTVVGLAASGRTPYVMSGLSYASEMGCHTIAMSCNKPSAVGDVAEVAIEIETGPEVLTGSTRLKAGTAQKMVVNMITTASMVGIGKVYKNLMVDVQQTNKKLQTRAENIVMMATEVTREKAKASLKEAEGHVKLAITMLLLDTDSETAKAKLDEVKGHIRKAID